MSADLVAAILAGTPGWGAASGGFDEADVRQVLDEAGRLADEVLAPLAAVADREGCRLVDGRVRLPEGSGDAWRALAEGGWIAPDLPEELGGIGLPLPLTVAAGLLLEGAAMPFLMGVGATRAAAHMLAAEAPDLAADWAPALAAGERAATICISEPDAGSDVGRIRTRAVSEGNGWRVTGTKCWISFGDHDLTPVIGHMMLARTGPAEAGTRGLSLFLVPSAVDGAPNGVTVERIEEKMGLHGSPTCVLRFEGAAATLIGEEGRGLPALFTMIELMRLQTGTQGAGVALRAAALARRYAAERRQGGRPDAAPPPITEHPDVARQCAEIGVRAVLATALTLEAAATLAAARAGDAAAQAEASVLLPLAKTFGGELASEAASGAVQVLGGAGYTREWPAERWLRDVRILTIYEGTTGMQAQDLLLRRLVREEGRGIASLLGRLRAEAAGWGSGSPLLDRLDALSDDLRARPPAALAAVADGYLRAFWAALSDHLAARLAATCPPAAAAGRWWRATSAARFDLALAEIARGVG
ncbi:acyl-CoA dehydrogenase family protein [Wenxinia marina]|uniref:Acyl-CoA dehydrogenase n=1 Tax=Wenxinia marina DSM 24838 TaxID=1123501 RepID=A0A0D0QDL0_9RHOB|nr:acyl-CoA dehydrogenase family protein [Wenxinia marina]KIQ70422.1 Acyl-CoA dehydrogenase [Wenxinia marina DSM 24838]GGL53309.1 acyl-CoA dehydrogenase [Wenxinia marina]